MLRLNTIFILAISLLVTLGIQAQDLHYTQYNLAPLSLNPALTGQFEGTFRIGGLYRDQSRNYIAGRGNQFSTPSVYIDAPVFRGFGKNDWIGIGANFLNDRAGTVSINNTVIMGGLSYHLALGKKSNTVISLGAEAGLIQRRVDKSEALFQDEITSGGGTGTSQDLNAITNDNVSYGDYNAGITVRSSLNKRMNFNIGFAMFHLSQPKYTTYESSVASSLVDQNALKLPRRLVTHGEFNVDMTDKWTLSPSFLYKKITNADQLAVQAMIGHHFNLEKDITLRFGAGYRLRDAAEALLGFDYKGLRLGVAYDFTTSSKAPLNNSRGAFEIAVSYIAKIRKTPVVKPVIFCPRF